MGILDWSLIDRYLYSIIINSNCLRVQMGPRMSYNQQLLRIVRTVINGWRDGWLKNKVNPYPLAPQIVLRCLVCFYWRR